MNELAFGHPKRDPFRKFDRATIAYSKSSMGEK